MSEAFIRLESLIGYEGLVKLSSCSIAVFGLGGVGGHAAEALCRSGIGQLALIDFDTVAPSNLNRQIVALNSTLGKKKTEVLKDRLLDINPELKINTYNIFYDADNASQIDLTKYDFVVDAIDSVKSKLFLISECVRNNIPIVSSMGTGNKLDPSRLCITDISKTSGCPLARVVRRELRKCGIDHLPVVFSDEIPIEAGGEVRVGSTAFVPSSAGIMLASYVVRTLLSR